VQCTPWHLHWAFWQNEHKHCGALTYVSFHIEGTPNHPGLQPCICCIIDHPIFSKELACLLQPVQHWALVRYHWIDVCHHPQHVPFYSWIHPSFNVAMTVEFYPFFYVVILGQSLAGAWGMKNVWEVSLTNTQANPWKLQKLLSQTQSAAPGMYYHRFNWMAVGMREWNRKDDRCEFVANQKSIIKQAKTHISNSICFSPCCSHFSHIGSCGLCG
jgi:hypothetical protein